MRVVNGVRIVEDEDCEQGPELQERLARFLRELLELSKKYDITLDGEIFLYNRGNGPHFAGIYMHPHNEFGEIQYVCYLDEIDLDDRRWPFGPEGYIENY